LGEKRICVFFESECVRVVGVVSDLCIWESDYCFNKLDDLFRVNYVSEMINIIHTNDKMTAVYALRDVRL